MKTPIFSGACTALVTPMKNGKIDYTTLDKLIEFQIDSGISAILVSGTTGENAVLTYNEHRNLIKHSVKRINGRVPLIAGTGSNDTAKAVKMTAYACEYGADAVLAVTPYYNKANKDGIVRHYKSLSDMAKKPVIVYNVPGRTGINIEPETYRKICDMPSVGGIKEASSNLSDAAYTSYICPDTPLYCGNDDLLIPMLSIGACGIISVMSNIFPEITVEICNLFFADEWKKASLLYKKYLNFSKLLFSDVNPIPIKHIMSKANLCSCDMRLPLTEMPLQKAKIIEQEYLKLTSLLA